MELVILLTVMSVLGAFTIRCMKNEDAIIELEDRIIADIRAYFSDRKKAKAARRRAEREMSASSGREIRVIYRNDAVSGRAA